MALFSDAGGSIVAVVAWIAIILSALMVVLWYADNFNTDKIVLEKCESDLSSIRKMVDDACGLPYYRAAYNPSTETGTLDINSSGICIHTENLSRCRKPLCELAINASIDLAGITDIIVEKPRGEGLTVRGE